MRLVFGDDYLWVCVFQKEVKVKTETKAFSRYFVSAVFILFFYLFSFLTFLCFYSFFVLGLILILFVLFLSFSFFFFSVFIPRFILFL